MATLVTTATIRAHDALTGPLMAMATRVHAINGRFQSGARQIAGAGQRLGMGLGAGAFGLGIALQKADEFNKNVLGVGIAAITEAMDATGKVNLQVPLDEMERISVVSMDMSRKLRMSATTISSIGETLAKAGMKSDKLKDTMEATATLSKTDFDTPAAKMAEFMNVLSIIHKPQKGESFGNFMRRQADMVLAAAAETQLSVGTIMEGMRQFQTIGAGMGMQTEDMLALIMGGARRGFNAIELGTALKSDLVRTLKPTAEGMSALGTLGIDMSNYAVMGPQDVTRAVSSLNRATGGLVKGKFATRLKASLMKAQKEGYTSSDGYIANVTDAIIKHGRRSGRTFTEEDRASLATTVRNSITTPQGKFNFIRMLTDLALKGATDDQIKAAMGQTTATKAEMEEIRALNPNASDAQLASLFEGRQLARNKALVESIRSGEFSQDIQTLRRMHGQGLDSVETLWSKSAFGNMRAMAAAFERLTIRLANTPAIQAFVNQLERAAEVVERIDGKTAAFIGTGLLLGTIAGPAMMAARGLWTLSRASLAVMAGMGRFVALPFLSAASGLRRTAIAATVLGRANTAAAATGLMGLARGLGAVAAVAFPVAAIAGVVALTQLDWGKVAEGAGAKDLFGQLSTLGGNLDGMVRSFLQLFNIDVKGSLLYAGIDALLGLLGKVISAVNIVIERIKQGNPSNNEVTGSPRQRTYGSLEEEDAALARQSPYPPGWMGKGLPPLSLLPDIGEPLNQPAAALAKAAQDLSAAASRLQQPPAPVVVNGGGSGGGTSPTKAVSPEPAKTNGANYRGQ